jgi:hypothetical protein
MAMLFLTIVDPSPASAGMTNPASKSAVSAASSAPTDVSSRRRRSSNRGGSAAGLAFMGMAIGTMGAIAAQQQRNDYYNRYDNGPGYYGGGPQYYGGGPYYGRRYYRPY